MSLYSDLNEVLTPYAQSIKGKADKSTTYTKTEVDTLISEVEVETDTTLGVSGAPADAAETGRQIGLVKADLNYVGDSLSMGNYTIPNANIDSSGVVTGQQAYDLLCYRVTEGNPVTFTTASSGVYAFFTDKPTIGSASYNNSRAYSSANVSVTASIPNTCKWVAIRVSHGASLSSFSMTPYVIGYVDKKVYYLTPEDFGAVGDGVSNDTSAIQAMFDYVTGIANRFVVVCNGKTGSEYLTNTINITTETRNHAHNISINNFCFGLLNNLMFSATNNNHSGFHFNNCRFIGNSSNNPIFANNYLFTASFFTDCIFQYFDHIIYCDVFEQELTFEHCYFINCKTCFYGTAFFTLVCRQCHFERCNHVLEQKLLNQNVSAYLRIAQEVCFDGCGFTYYHDFVIKLAAYSEVIVEKCYLEFGGLNTDGTTHIDARHGIWLYDDENYTRKKGVLIVEGNHFQDTVDNNYSPRLVSANNITFDTIIMRGNASYNTRFLAISGSTCTGIIEFFGNVLTKDTPTAENIYGDFSAMKLIGYVDGVFYINGTQYQPNN